MFERLPARRRVGGVGECERVLPRRRVGGVSGV